RPTRRSRPQSSRPPTTGRRVADPCAGAYGQPPRRGGFQQRIAAVAAGRLPPLIGADTGPPGRGASNISATCVAATAAIPANVPYLAVRSGAFSGASGGATGGRRQRDCEEAT